jgi:hypothetical protein
MKRTPLDDLPLLANHNQLSQALLGTARGRVAGTKTRREQARGTRERRPYRNKGIGLETINPLLTLPGDFGAYAACL